MATWGELLAELKALVSAGLPGAFDILRRKYLAQLSQHTGRNVILYATRWTQGGGDPQLTSITPEDLQGFMEVVQGLTGSSLDLIVHSPGGSAEATEALVSYLRSKFSDIRVIVPHAAMSAATMLACSGNEIVMGKHSFLGPIDPQIILQTELGARSVPAYAILEQFELAKREVKADPALLPAWLPILRQYGPAMIVQCQLHRQLAEDLVGDWLARFMLNGNSADAKRIARELADHANFKSHSRYISRDGARAMGLHVSDLDGPGNQDFQDAVLSVFHATTHTFTGTPAAKIIENQNGKAFLKLQAQQMVMVNQPPASPLPAGGTPPPPPPP